MGRELDISPAPERNYGGRRDKGNFEVSVIPLVETPRRTRTERVSDFVEGGGEFLPRTFLCRGEGIFPFCFSPRTLGISAGFNLKFPYFPRRFPEAILLA